MNVSVQKHDARPFEGPYDQRHGFAVFHAPTGANPFLPVEAIAALRAELPRPEVALQGEAL